MTNKEAIERITFARKGYLKLIEENVSDGQFVGDGVTGVWESSTSLNDVYQQMADAMDTAIKALEQPEARCEYYALCRHGRDENRLRARLGFCEYCNEDSDGYVTPIEKNGHAFVRFGMNGWELDLKANGWHGSAKIQYCPMCGRRLTDG